MVPSLIAIAMGLWFILTAISKGTSSRPDPFWVRASVGFIGSCMVAAGGLFIYDHLALASLPLNSASRVLLYIFGALISGAALGALLVSVLAGGWKSGKQGTKEKP